MNFVQLFMQLSFTPTIPLMSAFLLYPYIHDYYGDAKQQSASLIIMQSRSIASEAVGQQFNTRLDHFSTRMRDVSSIIYLKDLLLQ